MLWPFSVSKLQLHPVLLKCNAIIMIQKHQHQHQQRVNDVTSAPNDISKYISNTVQLENYFELCERACIRISKWYLTKKKINVIWMWLKFKRFYLFIGGVDILIWMHFFLLLLLSGVLSNAMPSLLHLIQCNNNLELFYLFYWSGSPSQLLYSILFVSLVEVHAYSLRGIVAMFLLLLLHSIHLFRFAWLEIHSQ